MKLNKILFIIVVLLIPIVVISFEQDDKTNFIMEKKDQDEDVKIKLLIDNDIKTLNLEDYIIGVVAAEMPASFNEEALKAQAVASRSYALYKKDNSDGEYDLVNNTSNQVYIDEFAMKEKWGVDFDYYFNKIKDCVLSTKGEVIVYDDEIIEALYFSMSSGNTEDAKEVFGNNIDYLQSVESKYDNSSITNYEQSKTFTKDEFINTLNLSCSNPNVENIQRDKSGYVSFISICNKEYKGTEMRSLLKLRSANFDIDTKSEDIIVTTYGYGHGVGMSQYGANGYAENGMNYKDILKHYYKNVEIKTIKDV